MTTWTLTPAEFAATHEAIGKINARAAKRGFTGFFTLTGERTTVTTKAGIEEVVFKVTLTGQAPSYAGWEFLAAVDTVGEGFVLRTAPGQDASDIDRQTLEAGRCEHCNAARARKYTYLVRNTETGEAKQVGSTCVKDFTGWAGKFVFLSTDEVARDLEDGFGGGYREPSWTVQSIVAVAAAIVAKRGYVKAGDWDRQPTKDVVLDYLTGTDKGAAALREEVGSPDNIQATKIISTLTQELTGDSDYVQNLRTVLTADEIGRRQVGLTASAVVAYNRLTETKVKAQAAPAKVTEFLGERGEKITVTGTVTTAKVTEGYYGSSVLVTVQTETGVAKMFTTAQWAWDVAPGQQVEVSGTVKAQETFRDEKQTVLTRPRAKVLVTV